ncbi:MAG: hypothetical protein NZM38_08915 [Cytophagales bacterium]|nr:hypothetical protein [Cytophagales bacterium]MDW8384880.1 hypothetical protein [Flammeovirgaceae bacterium]
MYQDGIFLGMAKKLQAAQASKSEAAEQDQKIKSEQSRLQRKIRRAIVSLASNIEKVRVEIKNKAV